LFRRGPARLVILFRLDQDVGGLEQVGGAESLLVSVVKSTAFLLTRLGWCHLLLEKRTHECVVLRFGSPGFVPLGVRLEAQLASFLQQQFFHSERASCFGPGGFGVGCRMMLDLLGDRLGRDFHAVDPNVAESRRRREHWFGASSTAARLARVHHLWRRPLGRIAEVDHIKATAHVARPSSNAVRITVSPP
jgi:hypothetical protein